MNLEDMTDKDWIIVRLLFLIITLDPSMLLMEDVEKTVKLYGNLIPAFDKLSYEHSQNGTFQDKYKDVQSFRIFAKTLNMEHSGDEDKDVQERRFFGSTSTILRQGNTNG
jgi:hypothetical protein